MQRHTHTQTDSTVASLYDKLSQLS